MILKLNLLFIFLCAFIFMQASEYSPAFDSVYFESDTTKLSYDTEAFEAESEPVVCALDSMMERMYSTFSFQQTENQFGFDSATVPVYPDSVLQLWMRQLPVVMPFVLNSRVKRFIELYAYQRRNQVSHMLGLAETYFPIFEKELDKRGMPHELKYLAVVESALNNHAVSRAGATGIWQIMYPTGRMLGLTINSVVDERRDPHRATDAALDYLERLYGMYDDWFLALAAYNCGPGNLNRAIRRSGGQRNYWQLLPFIPRETRGYVPAFIAATFVMENHEAFNIPVILPERQWTITDTVFIHERLTFALLSEKLHISEEVIAYLNPAFRRNFVPASRDGHALKLPVQHIAAFEAKADTLFKIEKESEPDPTPVAAASVASSPRAVPANSAKLSYTVKEGDNLGFIAEWYGIRAQDIRNWNNIRGNLIRVGQRLTIYVPENEVERYRNINEMTFAQKQSMLSSRRPSVSASSVASEDDCDCILHRVQSGDTLWDISRKYPGVTVNDILQANNLSNSRSLRPGMILKIKQP